jgi:hypothetical protein
MSVPFITIVTRHSATCSRRSTGDGGSECISSALGPGLTNSISACHGLKLLGLCSALLDVLMQGISEFQ